MPSIRPNLTRVFGSGCVPPQALEIGLDYRAKVNSLLEKENLFVMEQKTPRDVEIELADDPQVKITSLPFFQNGTQNRGLRCVLHPAPSGAELQHTPESRM